MRLFAADDIESVLLEFVHKHSQQRIITAPGFAQHFRKQRRALQVQLEIRKVRPADISGKYEVAAARRFQSADNGANFAKPDDTTWINCETGILKSLQSQDMYALSCCHRILGNGDGQVAQSGNQAER